MRINNIKELFENYSLQTKEEIILGTIIQCKNTMNTLGLIKPKDYTSNTGIVKLFESVSGINIEHQSNFFANDQVLQISDYHNNTYAYLNDVKSLMENYIPETSLLIGNDEIKEFVSIIQTKIVDLSKINDFQKYQTLNETALKTKIFAKHPINVLGVNLFDIEKLRESLNFKLLYSIIYSKTDKQMLFVGDNIVIIYDIKTDQLGEAHLINPEIPQLKVKPENYLEIIKEEISNNLFIIYTDRTSVKPLKFTDNLYGDVGRKELQEKIAAYNKKNSSVIK